MTTLRAAGHNAPDSSFSFASLRRTLRAFLAVAILPVGVVTVTSCGDDGSGPPAAADGGAPDAVPLENSLEDFLPSLPEPTGAAQAVFAGPITSANAAAEIPAGPASTGLVGDLFVRNARAKFVIQAASRAVGVNPYGGTVVDAIALDETGQPIGPEHFGELSIMYQAGRTCQPSSVEILLDGSGGGPAVLRAIGRGALNDWINLPGMGIFPIPDDIDPNVEDDVDCAITYTLAPDSTRLEVAYTLYNGGLAFRGPFALFTDAGGEVFSWAPVIGYHTVNLGVLETLTTATPVPYEVIQGPGVAYGLIPRADDVSKPNVGTSVLGVSLLVYGTDALLNILGEEGWDLDLARDGGVTYRADLAVGADPNDIEVAFQAGHPEPTALTPVTGTAAWQVAGTPAVGARVGFFRDADTDGVLGEDDPVVTFTEVALDGTWDARVPAGSYLVSAGVADVGASTATPVTIAATDVAVPALILPEPARYDYEVRDVDSGELIAARLTVVGLSPMPLDGRLHPPFDRRNGVVTMLHASHGTSVEDGALFVPAGGPYRIYVSHGPEWTYATRRITPTGGTVDALTFELRRAVDTTGYLATEFHQHSMGSPDSSVAFEDRLATLVTEGIEYFASTDHDFLVDYAPLITAAGLEGVVGSAIGVESTPFAWGHFISWPLDLDANDPSGGAPDWGAGQLGRDLLPSELMAESRRKGAQIVQVNHGRSLGLSGFQSYFDVVHLTFDFAARTYHGNPGDLPVEAQVLRQPEDIDLYADDFDTLEVWNAAHGSKQADDSNGDGWTELVGLDSMLRDWLNFLAFGRLMAPMGNSDTHRREADPAGLPRTLVRVPDDTSAGLLAGVVDDVVATLKGMGPTPYDVVVTNGPVIRVSVDGGVTSAIGRVVAPTSMGGAVTFTVSAQVPSWMAIDTVEIFANATFDPIEDDLTALTPLGCFTTRTGLAANDTCGLATLGGGAQALVVTEDAGAERRETTLTFTLAPGDLATRAGARGQDAVVVVRVSGQSAMFPLVFEGNVGLADVPGLVEANTRAEVDAVFATHSTVVFPTAFTGPIRVDFDGGGFAAPFEP